MQPFKAIDNQFYNLEHYQIKRPGGAGKKHEIYMTVFGDHLFYDFVLQGQEETMVSLSPPDPLLQKREKKSL